MALGFLIEPFLQAVISDDGGRLVSTPLRLRNANIELPRSATNRHVKQA